MGGRDLREGGPGASRSRFLTGADCSPLTDSITLSWPRESAGLRGGREGHPPLGPVDDESSGRDPRTNP